MFAFKNLVASGVQPPPAEPAPKEIPSIGNLPVSEIMQFFTDPNPRSVRRLGSHPSKAVGVRGRNTNSGGPTRVEPPQQQQQAAAATKNEPTKPTQPETHHAGTAQGKKKRRRNKKK